MFNTKECYRPNVVLKTPNFAECKLGKKIHFILQYIIHSLAPTHKVYDGNLDYSTCFQLGLVYKTEYEQSRTIRILYCRSLS